MYHAQKKHDPKYKARMKHNRQAYAKKRPYWKEEIRYNISAETMDLLIREAAGRCQLCGEASEKLCVDHCHETGKVRGLLCYRCNTGLGHLRDSVRMLFRGITYLVERG